MEFFIFLIFMSFVSFAVAFLAYAVVLRLFGNKSTVGRYAQLIGIPVAIIGYDFLTITATPPNHYYIGAVPMVLLALMLLYYRFIASGSMDTSPAPSDFQKVSRKSLRKQAKKSQKK